MQYLYKHDLDTSYMKESFQKANSLILICLGILLFMAFATLENETLIIPNSLGDSLPVNNTNIVLVHGSWSDGSIWSKVTNLNGIYLVLLSTSSFQMQFTVSNR